MTDGPLIVQSDKTVLLEVGHEQAGAARAAIAPFAELERAPEHVHTYRITPLALWNVRAAGQGTLVRGRSARRVKLIEVPPQERGPIARVFPEQVPMGAGIFVKNGVVPDKSPESFEKAAPGIPVFRVQPY